MGAGIVQDWNQYQPLPRTVEPASGAHDLSVKKSVKKPTVFKGEHGGAYLPELRVPAEGADFNPPSHYTEEGEVEAPFDPKPEIPGLGGEQRPFIPPATPPEGGLSNIHQNRREGHFEVSYFGRLTFLIANQYTNRFDVWQVVVPSRVDCHQ